MPKCKNYLLNIEKFYRFQTFDHILFGYVQGLRKALPSMKVSDAIKLFLETFEIQEDDYCFDSARQTYYRILSSIVDSNIEKGIKPDNEMIL